MDDKNGKQEESGVIKAQKPGPREFGRASQARQRGARRYDRHINVES